MEWRWPWSKPSAKATSRVTAYGDIGWSTVGGVVKPLPNTNVDYQREADDLWLSSIVAAYLGWIVRTFPEAPICLMDTDDTGQSDYVLDDAFIDLLEHPNPSYNGDHLMAGVLTDYWCKSDAYIRKVRNNGREVSALLWVPNDQIRVLFGGMSDNLIDHYEYVPTQEKLPPSDVIHFRNGASPYTTGRTGLSPLYACLREIVTDNRASNMMAAVMGNMGIVGGILSPKGSTGPMGESAFWDTQERERVKAGYTAGFTGDRAGNVMVLSTEGNYTPLGHTPEQMALDVVRQYPETRIGAAFGISPMVVGLKSGLDRSTFSNYEEARQAAYESNIIPTKTMFARVLQNQLYEPDFAGGRSGAYTVGWDYRAVRVLQDDEDAKATRLVSLVTTGILTANEARAQLGLDPVDGADELGPKAEPKPDEAEDEKPPKKDIKTLIGAVESARLLLGIDEADAADAWREMAQEDVISGIAQ